MEFRLGEMINEHILKLNPLATVYVGVFQAVSRAAVRQNSSVAYVPWGPFGRTIMVVESPYESDSLGKVGPRGLRYYVATAAPSQDDAMRYMVYAASHVHTMMQISANASAHSVHLRLLTIHGPGTIPFRELLWEPELSHPINSRLVDEDVTPALFSATWNSNEDRLGRAAVQYELAMRRLHSHECPLALAHLYMGVETITKAYIRKRCEELGGMSEADLAVSFGIAADDEKLGHKLEIEIRRQLIFANDNTVYKNIRKVSDGLEHGFATWEEIWSIPEDTFVKSAGYLRNAIFYVANLDAVDRARLLGAPFDAPVEGGPTLAFEATALIQSIDLRARDFKIANAVRVMTVSAFDEGKGEYRYEYRLEAQQVPKQGGAT